MKVLKNLSWIFFANLFVALVKWLFIIFIAKNLSPTEVGVYTLAFAVTAPIFIFFNFNLRSLYITSENNNFYDFLFTRNLLNIVALIFSIAVAYLIYPNYLIIILLVCLTKYLDLKSDLYYAIPHKENNLSIIGKFLIIKYILILIVFIAILLISNDLVLSLTGQVVIQTIFFYIYERKHFVKKYNIIKNRFNTKKVKEILFIAFPLGFVGMLVSLNSNIPRYFLELFESPKELGYFSAIVQISMIVGLFMNSITQVILPRFSNFYKQNKIPLLRKYIFSYMPIITIIIGFILIIICFLFGGNILNLVYGSDYAKYSNILLLVAIAISINLLSWILDAALLAIRYISIQPKISIFNFIATIGIGYILINNHGIEGAAITLIVNAILHTSLRLYFINKRLKLIS